MTQDAFLLLPSLAFEGIVRARDALYRRRLLRARSLPRPVCSVGNLTLGGTGKTPMVVYLARRLRSFGIETAVLTRGYRRRNPGRDWIVAPGAPSTDAVYLGDEAALVRRSAPDVWLGVARDRHRAGIEIARRAPGVVFLLDDGFQHRRLARDLDLVLIDPTQPLESNHVAPRGTLREPLAALERADAVLVRARRGSPDASRIEELLRHVSSRARLFHFRHRIVGFVPFGAWRDGRAERSEPGAAFLAAAVGNPGRFRCDVECQGVEVRGARSFRDHHPIAAAEWRTIAESARGAGAPSIVTTAKDAVKIAADVDYPLFVAEQATEVEEQEELDCLVRERMARPR